MRVRIDESAHSGRGYEKHARKVARKLVEIPGLRPSEESLFTAACRARGLEPGMYLSKPQLRFGAQTSAGEAFASLFAQLVEVVRANVDGTLQQQDTEFLHDLRVAVRRARSALKAGAGVVNEQTHQTLAAEMKWMGDLTTPSRDLDVHLLGYDKTVAHAPEPEHLEPFRKLLARNCRKAHTALNRGLQSKRFTALVNSWTGELADPRAMTGPQANSQIADVAHQRLNTAWRRVRKRGRAITADSPAEAVHDLRKRCKELRYLLEFFGSLYRTRAHRQLVTELKLLQENLGEFQDAESQRFLVTQYADQLASADAPAHTLLAMGRLEEHLEHRQLAARDEFAQRWEYFDRKHNHRLFTSMMGER